MTVKLTTNDKIAETSSKGNQEKWLDSGLWYKLDQFGYEALAEAFTSKLLEQSNIERDTAFEFVRYDITKVKVHNRIRVACVSRNFLSGNQSIITISSLFKRLAGASLKTALQRLNSDKKRMNYLVDAVKDYTDLRDFDKYLTLLFEVDSLVLNDDRHLNNIAVIEENGRYSYCPIFDNGAGLLSNMQLLRADIEPKALIQSLTASPFNMTFNREINTARALFGGVLRIPCFSQKQIRLTLEPMLEYYPERDRGIILDRVTECVKQRQRHFSA